MKKYGIDVTAFEGGVLLPTIWDSKNRETLKDVFDQLLGIQKNMREEAGVQIEDHGDAITLVDKDGTTITRPKWEWEK